MRGGEKSAQAEALSFVIKRWRGVFLAGTALVAAPAFLALSLGAARAGDLVNDSGTYVVHGKLTVDDVTNENGGRLLTHRRPPPGGRSHKNPRGVAHHTERHPGDTHQKKNGSPRLYHTPPH